MKNKLEPETEMRNIKDFYESKHLTIRDYNIDDNQIFRNFIDRFKTLFALSIF